MYHCKECQSLVPSSFLYRLGKVQGKDLWRQTHLSGKLLNPLDRIGLVLHIRIRVLECDRVLGGVLAGLVLAVLVSAAFGGNPPFRSVVDDFVDGGLELFAGDVPVAAAEVVVVSLAVELEAVRAEEGGHADHVLVHGVGGEVDG